MFNKENLIPTPALPEFKVTKSGYEIRSDILAMAKDLVTHDFQVKWNGWEMTSIKDEKTGQIISKVDMPEFPGLNTVLDTAEKMYAFVSAGHTSKTNK